MELKLKTKILYKQLGVSSPEYMQGTERDFIIRLYKTNSIEQLIVSFNYNIETKHMFFTVANKGSFTFNKNTMTWWDLDKNVVIDLDDDFDDEDDSDMIEVQMTEFEKECYDEAANIVNKKLYEIIEE